MNIDNHDPAKFTGPGELRLLRVLPGPIERVWQYVSDPEKRARWFAAGILEQKQGGRVELLMRQAAFAPEETPPEKYQHMHKTGVIIAGRVIRCEPPHLLIFTFGSDDSEVTFELKTQGSQVLLVLTHRAKGGDLPDLGNFAAGWHTHISLLVAEVEGTRRPPYWPTHNRLSLEYQKMLEAAGHA